MKKFIKIMVIAGLICLFLGIGVMSAGAVMGGDLKDLVRYSRNSWSDQADFDYLDSLEYTTESFDIESISSLKVESNMTSVYIEENVADEEITVSYPLEFRGIQVSSDAGKLDIQYRFEKKGKRIWEERWEKEAPLYIRIPEGYRFKKAELEADMGEIEADVLNADELELSCDMGAIEIYSGTTDRLEIDCNMGNAVYGGICSGSAEADCDMGKIVFSMEGEEDDYQYEVDSDMGSVNLGSWETASGHQKIRPDSDLPKIKIDCDMGNIDVEFLEKIGKEN